MPSDFQTAFCAQYHCTAAEFPQAVLWRCLPPQWAGTAHTLWRLSPTLFQQDLQLISTVARCTEIRGLAMEIENFRYMNPNTGLLRRRLKIRLSGQRLVQLAQTVFAAAPHPAVPSQQPMSQPAMGQARP